MHVEQRCHQTFESLLSDQAIHIGLRRLDLRDVGAPAEVALVHVLRGDGIGAKASDCQRLAVISSSLTHWRPDVEVSARLDELLVEIGGVAICTQYVTGPDLASRCQYFQLLRYPGMRAARIDRSPYVGLQAARQFQARAVVCTTGADDGDVGHSARLRQFVQMRVLRRA